jgi:hypothetical protein
MYGDDVNSSHSSQDAGRLFSPPGPEAFCSYRFIHRVEPSPSLPYLGGSVLRPFSQYDLHLIDRLAECIGFDDFGKPDVFVFVQEKAMVYVHTSQSRCDAKRSDSYPQRVNIRTASVVLIIPGRAPVGCYAAGLCFAARASSVSR